MSITDPHALIAVVSTIPSWGNGHGPLVRRIRPDAATRRPRIGLRQFGVRRMGPEARPRPHRVGHLRANDVGSRHADSFRAPSDSAGEASDDPPPAPGVVRCVTGVDATRV